MNHFSCLSSVSRQRTLVPPLTASSTSWCILTTASQPSQPCGRIFGGRSTSHSYSWCVHSVLPPLISSAILCKKVHFLELSHKTVFVLLFVEFEFIHSKVWSVCYCSHIQQHISCIFSLNTVQMIGAKWHVQHPFKIFQALDPWNLSVHLSSPSISGVCLNLFVMVPSTDPVLFNHVADNVCSYMAV